MFSSKALLISSFILGAMPPGCWGVSIDFDLPHGLLPGPAALTLSSDAPGASIYYTLDGSLPSDGADGSPPAGSRYTIPIPIQGSAVVRAKAFVAPGVASVVKTRTYLLAESVRSQPATPEGFPTTWGRVGSDYAMDSRVVHDPRYDARLLDDLRTLPWISLVASPGDLFGTNGVYSNTLERGSAWERPASIEWIDPDVANPGFQVDAGFQILGDSSRIPEVPKHSFRIQFKSKYGPSRLDYPAFANTLVTQFDTIDLLCGSVDDVPQNFIGSGLAVPLHLRDAFLKQSQIDMGRPGVHTGYAHLFLNGLYWGLYRLSERPNDGYASDYFGGKKSDYDVLKHLDFAQLEVVDGDRLAWDAMYQIASLGLADPTRYAAIQDYLDLDEFADYMIVNMHLGNGDWPQKNWYALRKRSPRQKFHFFCWDGDAVLGLFGITLNKTDFATPNTPAFLYAQLRANAEFRVRFGDRVQKHTMGEGALSITANQARLQRIAATMGRGMVGESARWGDAYFARPGKNLFTFDDHWLPELQRVLTEVIPGRHPISIAHFRAAQLFPTIDAPLLSPAPGLLGAANLLSLGTSSGAGLIYYTVDGTDPRLEGGAVSAAAQAFSAPIPLARPALVSARSLENSQWSALVSGMYYPSPAPQWTRIERVKEGVRLEFVARPGFRYEILSRDKLGQGLWRSVTIFSPQDQELPLAFIDAAAPSSPGTRYYRIVGF
ncbi:MAG: CotH kinase family protein [Verrucomicrobia bacterium]|nr:CotH kinase family protein [Verrucomicrobiota bacterium]MBI3867093.1 CotH kinase family protein [Verrucomicrobiota bacterium]